jgi:hypothetical protein
MNREEFATWTMALKTYYPKENLLPNNQAMELWYKQLQDIPYDVAETALNKWVATNKWSPSIADIREAYVSVAAGDYPLAGEEWDKVMQAICKYGSYNPAEALASLNPITANTVRQIGGFRQLCFSENIVADRANFYRIYDRNVERARQQALISPQLKITIAGIAQRQQALLSNEK